MKALFVVAFAFLPFTIVIAQSSIASSVGIVESMQNHKACLTIKNSQLKVGEKIYVVFSDKPQLFKSAMVREKLSATCSRDVDLPSHSSSYLIKMPVNGAFVELSIVGKRQFRVAKGFVTTDISGDGKPEYFRTCTTAEGHYLTVWSGKPLVGRKVWHRYFYVPYDTEPSCVKKDYEGT